MERLFTDQDLEQLAQHGVSPAEAQRQIALLRRRQAYATLVRPCTVGDGIEPIPHAAHEGLLRLYTEAASAGRLARFVPASGAATRMFAHLLRVLQYEGDLLRESLEQAAETSQDARETLAFLDHLPRFAFRGALAHALRRRGFDLAKLAPHGPYRPILEALLLPEGLAYAHLPKGLLLFHDYPEGARTAFEEQLVEAAGIVRDAEGIIRAHFTISPEHRARFEHHLEEVRARWEPRWRARFAVSFSEQSPATDTLALDDDGQPFRADDGRLLLRPAGHGALLDNLDAFRGDIILLKNIDNVAPDHRKGPTYLWSKLLVGYLVRLQREIFELLDALDAGEGAAVPRAEAFVARHFPGSEEAAPGREALRKRLDRPLRVCGMVPARGEPGGAPFWVRERDGRIARQIVESAQVRQDDSAQRAVFAEATHFNPVFIACAVRDRLGQPYDLDRFADPEAVIIARKTHAGRPLWALERPGLWNGGMARWNSVFVEVPEDVFNPVKTVNDLLRESHQPA